MKRSTLILALTTLAAFAVYMAAPLMAGAAEADESPGLPPLLITELQAGGSGSASEEFIELYNTTAEPIDLSAYEWRLQIAGSTATDWSTPSRNIVLNGVVAPGESYVLASQFTSGGQQVQYLPAVARAWFSAGIAFTGGHIRLAYVSHQLQAGACVPVQTVVDQLEWSAPSAGSPAIPSLDGRTVFMTFKTTGLQAGQSLQRGVGDAVPVYQDGGSDAADFVMHSVPSPGLVNTVHPTGAPATIPDEAPGLPEDGCDPNPPTEEPGDDDPPTEEPGGGDPPATEEPPTVPPANQGLGAPVITELLPNPGAPQTDTADEFIELHNPNTAAFDLSGYMLEVGTTTKRRYTFPPGTELAGGAYAAYFSAVTGLGMSNTGGQVRLLSPGGTVLIVADPYAAAKENQAWALVEGKWQWTLTPTPNTANSLLIPTVKGAKTAAATTKKAATKTRAAATQKAKKTKEERPTTATLLTDAVATRYPLHPGVLAVVGVFAVLYGAYEYRQDMANYFRRLRNHRSARRKDRQEPKGRRGD